MDGSIFLVLNLTHQVLLERGELPSKGDLNSFVSRMESLGLELAPPVGVSPPQFVFLCPHFNKAPEGFEWVSFEQLPAKPIFENAWNLYCEKMLGGTRPPSKKFDVFHFGNTLEMASRLAHLVIKGKKRATSDSIESMKKRGLSIPNVGMVSVVTDGFGIPLCLIQTERVDIAKFKDIKETVAIGEGEGDLSIDNWREEHEQYFKQEALAYGLEFNDDSDIFTEWFTVLKVFQIQT